MVFPVILSCVDNPLPVSTMPTCVVIGMGVVLGDQLDLANQFAVVALLDSPVNQLLAWIRGLRR